MKLWLFCLLFLFGCLRTHQEILEAEGDFVYKKRPSVSQEPFQPSQELQRLKERIDFLERNFVNRQDMESALNQVQQKISEINLQLTTKAKEQKAAEKLVQEKKSLPVDLFQQAGDLFKNKQWRQAILSYAEFRKQNKNSKHVKTAALNMGISFMNLGLHKEAKVFFQEVMTQFPKSQEARTARLALKTLKKK